MFSLYKIGLAVGETQGLLKNAKHAQLDMTYELARDYEVVRLQCYKLILCCRATGSGAEAYKTEDMLKTPWYTKAGNWFSNLLADELFADQLVDEPTDDDDTDEEQMNVLQEIRQEMHKLMPNHRNHSAKPTRNHTLKTTHSQKKKKS